MRFSPKKPYLAKAIAAVLIMLGSFFPYLSRADELALTISNLRVSTTDTTADIQWTTTMPASGRVEYGTTSRYGTIYGVQGERRTSHLVTLTNLTPATTYHYRVDSLSDFREDKTCGQYITTDLAKDRDAPEITDIAVPFQTPTMVVIQWRTNEVADSQVVFGKSPSYGQQAGDGARVTVHDLTVTGLQPSTAYHFQVKGRDAAGNVGISQNFTFRTTSTVSGTPSLELVNIRPVAVNDQSITDTTAEISWRTTTLADGRVHWGETSNLGRGVQLPPPRDFFHATKLTGLQPATTYYFRVESRDVFGVSVQSPIFSFATRGAIPAVIAPTPGRVLGVNTPQDLLFYASFDRSLNADFAAGDPTARNIGTPRRTSGNGGIRSEAADLPGSSQLIFDGMGNTADHAGTITFWFKPYWNGADGIGHSMFMNMPSYQTTPEKYLVIGKTGNQGTAQDFMREPNKLYFGLEDVADKDYRYFVQDAGVRAGTWVFIAVSWSYDGGVGRVYLNGLPAITKAYLSGIEQSAPLASAPTQLFGPFSLGSAATPIFGSQDGDVVVDDLAIFGRVLNDDEIKLLYTEGVGRWLPQAAGPVPTPTGRVLGASTLQYTPASALLKTAGEPDVYAIINGQKHLISGPSSFAAYGYRWTDVRTVQPSVLEKIPHARLVRTPGDGIYYLYQRPQNLWLKLLLPSPTVFISYPENFWGNVITINEIDFASYPEVRLIKTPNDQTVYLLEGVIKRHVDSDAVFDRLQLPRSHVAEVNSVHLNFYPVGEVAR